MSNSENTMLSAQVPTQLRDELSRLARRHDRSVSAELRSAIRLHLIVAQDTGGLSPLARPVSAAADRDPEGLGSRARPVSAGDAL
jgi:hypothetical protein